MQFERTKSQLAERYTFSSIIGSVPKTVNLISKKKKNSLLLDMYQIILNITQFFWLKPSKIFQIDLILQKDLLPHFNTTLSPCNIIYVVVVLSVLLHIEKCNSFLKVILSPTLKGLNNIMYSECIFTLFFFNAQPHFLLFAFFFCG